MYKDSCLRKAKIAVQSSWRWYNIIVVTKKKQENLGKIPKGGGLKNLYFPISILETQ